MSVAYIPVGFFSIAKLVKPASGRCLQLRLSNGKHISASFVLQDLPSMRDEVEEATPIVDPKGQPTAQSAQPSVFDK